MTAYGLTAVSSAIFISGVGRILAVIGIDSVDLNDPENMGSNRWNLLFICYRKRHLITSGLIAAMVISNVAS